ITLTPIPTTRIQQRRTTTRTTRPTRREKPLHDTHPRRSRSTNRGRRLNKPLQSNPYTRRTSRTTSKTITHSHPQRNKETRRTGQEHTKHPPTQHHTTRT